VSPGPREVKTADRDAEVGPTEGEEEGVEAEEEREDR
jgi:hypothetical protein